MKILYNTICWVRSFVFFPISGRETERKMKNPAKPITFPYDRNKATQAILWLLHRHGGSMDKLKLVKLLFYADREHLARYGRPIVGGQYWAMDLGPVSGELKTHVDSATAEAALPFEGRGDYEFIAKEPPNEDELSESDMEILDEIYSQYSHIDSIKLSTMTHELNVYKKNKPERGSRKPVSYEDFFLDLRDAGMLEIICEDQKVRSIFE